MSKLFIVMVSDDNEHWFNHLAFISNTAAINYAAMMNAKTTQHHYTLSIVDMADGSLYDYRKKGKGNQ